MILQVYVGENLHYTVGRLRYSSDTGANPTASDTSKITAFIIKMLVIIIICVVIKKSKKRHRVLY